MNFSKFTFLNQFAKSEGTVILGSDTLAAMPLNELAQDFEIKEHLYNRSSSNMTITEVTEHFQVIISNMFPNHIIVNLGETELNNMAVGMNIAQLVEQYRWMLYKIHSEFPKAQITVTSVTTASEEARQFNDEIRNIADEFGCDFLSLPEKTADTNPNEFNITLFKALRLSFYKRGLSCTDIAEKAILRFS